jgi:hypothetical protein
MCHAVIVSKVQEVKSEVCSWSEMEKKIVGIRMFPCFLYVTKAPPIYNITD